MRRSTPERRSLPRFSGIALAGVVGSDFGADDPRAACVMVMRTTEPHAEGKFLALA